MLEPDDAGEVGAGSTVVESSYREDPGTILDPGSDGDTAFAPSPTGSPAGDPGSRSASSSAAGLLAPGQMFGKRYRIIELLGTGGMGAVYHAWDSELEIDVAMKVIRPEAAKDQEMVAELDRRFKQELLLAREVTHRNVVRIHDLGEIESVKYITMTLIDGEDLETILSRHGKLPISTSLQIIRDVLAGLVAAHEAGVVHRDLKPANIMIARDTGEAFIMDFGVACSAGAAEGRSDEAQVGGVLGRATHAPARAGEIVGTFEYMSPEQFRGGEIDQRSDLYTVGLILYDMLRDGQRVDNPHAAVGDAGRRCKRPPPSLRDLDPEIPEPLSDMVSRCLEPDPADRFQTTRELAEHVDRLDEEGHLKPIQRHLTGKLMVMASAVVVALVAITWWLASLRTPPAAPESMSILIADIDNRSAESAFEGSLEQALSIAMEGAGFIDAYPRPKAREIAGELRPQSPLDETMSQLVARREGIDVILVPALLERDSGYRITVRALDAALEPEKEALLAEVSVFARGRDDVLPAVGRLASDLRRRLGDTKPESARLAEAETFTASSLEAMRSYAVGQQLAFQGRFEEAIQAYEQAVSFDPEFGRAYAGLAVVSANLGEKKKAEEYFSQAMARIDRMTEREKSRTRGGYYLMTGNHQQAVEEYETLLENYPADTAGHANLALAYFFQRDMTRALEEGRLAVELNPSNVPQRNNVALYAMYAGSFESAIEEARAVIELNPEFVKAYVAQAISELALGNRDQAREVLRELERISVRGASFAAIGLADLALYSGRSADAVGALEAAILEDEANGFGYDAAVKTVTLAEAHLAAGEKRLAVEAIDLAISMQSSLSVSVPAARLLLAVDRPERALELAEELKQRLEPDSQAYALILEGEARLLDADPRGALNLFLEAQEVADTWLGRFALGRAYLELEAFPEAHGALDACVERRGEATAVFLDDRPTYRYFPPVLYYLGRVQEGLGSSAAAESYSDYIAIKQGGDGDPLVEDARRRLETIGAIAATG